MMHYEGHSSRLLRCQWQALQVLVAASSGILSRLCVLLLMHYEGSSEHDRYARHLHWMKKKVKNMKEKNK